MVPVVGPLALKDTLLLFSEGDSAAECKEWNNGTVKVSDGRMRVPNGESEVRMAKEHTCHIDRKSCFQGGRCPEGCVRMRRGAISAGVKFYAFSGGCRC